MSLRGVKKITLLVIARSKEDYFACHCEPRRDKAHKRRLRLPRFARNGGLPRFLGLSAMIDVLGNATFCIM